MELVRKRGEYTDEEIERFQDHIDVFFVEYMKETGVEGVTNYIHMLGSGHVKYYMAVHCTTYQWYCGCKGKSVHLFCSWWSRFINT